MPPSPGSWRKPARKERRSGRKPDAGEGPHRPGQGGLGSERPAIGARSSARVERRIAQKERASTGRSRLRGPREPELTKREMAATARAQRRDRRAEERSDDRVASRTPVRRQLATKARPTMVRDPRTIFLGGREGPTARGSCFDRDLSGVRRDSSSRVADSGPRSPDIRSYSAPGPRRCAPRCRSPSSRFVNRSRGREALDFRSMLSSFCAMRRSTAPSSWRRSRASRSQSAWPGR